MATPTTKSLVARKIGDVGLGLFGAPEYLERHAAPESVADLEDHDRVGYDRDDQMIRGFEALGLTTRRSDYVLRTDSDLAYLAAMRSGAGLGICQIPLGNRYGLVRVLPGAVELALEMWLVVHEDLRDVARIRALLDFLWIELSSYVQESER